MSQREIPVYLSGVANWDDLHGALASTFGFPFYGRANRDALRDHLRDLVPGCYCLVPGLKKGDHLCLGIFGLGGLKRRNRLLAEQFLKLWDDVNRVAREYGSYTDDFVVLKMIDSLPKP